MTDAPSRPPKPMLARLFEMLSGAEPRAPLPPGDARLALAALMVRAARADGEFSPVERAEIGRALARRHGLSDAETAALLAEAEAVEAEAPDTVRFTRQIKRAVPYEERAAVVEALWRVVLADGVRDPEEDAFVRSMIALIGVSDRDSALARQRAAKG